MNSLIHKLSLGISILLAVNSGWSQEPPATQESAIVGVPAFIKAGEDLHFTIKLDRAPNFDGGVINYYIVDPLGSSLSTSTPPISAGQKEVAVIFHIVPSAHGGKFTIHVFGFWAGLETIPIKASDVSFEVIPNANIIFPSAAEIQINPSQVQLFRRAAFALQLQVQNFKAVLAQYNQESPASLDAIIRRNVGDALESLKKTQLAFHELGNASAQDDNEHVFFDDLRISYEEVLKGLTRNQGRSSATGRNFGTRGSLMVATHTKAPQSNYPIISQAALRPFEQNEAAYNVAADAQSLTFDLTVNSSPVGASLCYHRRGDACHQNPDGTNTVIKSLPLAIWIVKFDKPGYKTEEREHDPFREPNHVINVDLKR